MKTDLRQKNFLEESFGQFETTRLYFTFGSATSKSRGNAVWQILDPQNRNCRNEANFEPNKSFVKKFKCGKLFKSLLNIIKHKHLHNFDLG